MQNSPAEFKALAGFQPQQLQLKALAPFRIALPCGGVRIHAGSQFLHLANGAHQSRFALVEENAQQFLDIAAVARKSERKRARFPEPLVLIDWTDLGDEAAGTEEVLHYVHDALGSVVGLTDAGDPDATPEPVPPKLVERYDYDPYGKTYVESWDATKQAAAGVPGLDADTPPRPAWGGARQRRS